MFLRILRPLDLAESEKHTQKEISMNSLPYIGHHAKPMAVCLSEILDEVLFISMRGVVFTLCCSIMMNVTGCCRYFLMVWETPVMCYCTKRIQYSLHLWHVASLDWPVSSSRYVHTEIKFHCNIKMFDREWWVNGQLLRRVVSSK